jgi:hypothetical protein
VAGSYCSREGDYSNEGAKVLFADGGRFLQLKFNASPAFQWNQEHFWTDREKRGVCKGFSFGSRRRMMNRLNQVSCAAALPLFVTLTLPDDVFDDSVTVMATMIKTCMDTFIKRLHRVVPDAAGFWRVEWKARKSGNHEGKLFPHAHSIMWGIPTRDDRRRYDPETMVPRREAFIPLKDKQLPLAFFELATSACGLRIAPSIEAAESTGFWDDGPVPEAHRRGLTFDGQRCVYGTTSFKKYGRWCKYQDEQILARAGIVPADCMSFFDWASLAWYHVVGSGNTDHFLAGVGVEQIRSWGGVLSYCSKYMSKMDDNNFLTDVPIGRSWGVFNRSKIPWANMIELPLPDDVGVRIRRIARRYLASVTGRHRKFPYGLTLYCDCKQWARLWAAPPDTPF